MIKLMSAAFTVQIEIALCALCWRYTDLHLNICVREVVLWWQLPVIVNEMVQNGWAEHRLKNMQDISRGAQIAIFAFALIKMTGVVRKK